MRALCMQLNTYANVMLTVQLTVSLCLQHLPTDTHRDMYIYIYMYVCICKYVCVYVYKAECSVLATAILDICQANFLRYITKSQDRPNEFACVVECHWLVTPTDLKLNRGNSGSPAGLSPPEKNSPQKNVASAALHSDSAESTWAFQVWGGMWRVVFCFKLSTF